MHPETEAVERLVVDEKLSVRPPNCAKAELLPIDVESQLLQRYDELYLEVILVEV